MQAPKVDRARGRKSAPLTFKLAALAMVLAFCEGLCFVAFRWRLADEEFVRKDYSRLSAQITTETVREFGKTVWDRELGWSMRPFTTGDGDREGGGKWSWSIDAVGARTNPYEGAAPRVSAYGDSYAYCTSVNNDETWEYELSKLTGTTVLNFGVGAYGTDQAVWKLAGNLPRHRTDVVVLVVMSEDIGRLLSMYRPFYQPKTGLKVGFKPMLQRAERGFIRLPNPLDRTESLADFSRAYEAACRYDYWYLKNRSKVRVGFPFTLSLLDAARYVLLDQEDTNRFELPEARDRLLYVLGEFVEMSRRYDFRPVVLFVPHPREVAEFAQGEDPSYRGFVARLEDDRAFDELMVIDLLRHEFDLERFNNRPFQGHASPYGNQVIARVLHDALRPLLNSSGKIQNDVHAARSRADVAPPAGF